MLCDESVGTSEVALSEFEGRDGRLVTERRRRIGGQIKQSLAGIDHLTEAHPKHGDLTGMREADAEDGILTGRDSSISLDRALQQLLARCCRFYQDAGFGRSIRPARCRHQEQSNGSKNAGASYHLREKRLVPRAGISLPINVCKTMRCSIKVCSSLSVSISLARSEAWRST